MLGAHLAAAVAETVQPAHASLWLRPANESKNGGEQSLGAGEPK